MHMGIFLFKAPCCYVFLVLSLDMEELNSVKFIVHKKRANDTSSYISMVVLQERCYNIESQTY